MIPTYAFSSCSSLQTIVIPDKVTIIMSKVFAEKFPDIAKDFDAIGYINSNDEFQSELIDKLVKEETEKTV